MPPLSPEGDYEAAAQFVLRLRGRGIRDLSVLRALETVPRALFVPQRLADLAFKDVSLPIACGQTMPAPYDVARIAEALKIEAGHRILEIGTGSGYCTAILARIGASVLSLERYQSLATAARTRLDEIGLMNAECVWADGLDLPDSLGAFDRILVHALVDPVPDSLLARLSEDGALLCARPDSGGGQSWTLVTARGEGGFDEEPVMPARLRRLEAGLSQVL